MTAIIVLQVRNDKERGILVLTIRQVQNETLYFFKPHHQPLRQHPSQVQEIVKRSSPTTRTKSVTFDAITFLRQYWNGTTFEFMGVILTSTDDQVSKTYSRLLNKEVGAIKRKEVIATKKQEKAAAELKKRTDKLFRDEQAFQVERARRIHELLQTRQPTQTSSTEQAQTDEVDNEMLNNESGDN